MKSFEEICFNVYKSITPKAAKLIIPLIDCTRKLNNKPPIPLREKLCEFEFPIFDKKVIMLHGVSVGEVLSLEKLINRIKNDFPDHALVLTVGTVTGIELARKKYGEIADFITYFPLDIYESCKKFVEKINPSVVLIAETELWPNFAYACHEKNIPTYIINGRVSDKSYPSYLKIKNFIKLILKNYTGVFCQSEIDKQRFLSLGANIDNTSVMKNLKFEIDKKECDIDLKVDGSKLLIAGSTHPQEEEIVIKTYIKLKEKTKNLKLLIAPRHLTRLKEVKKTISDFNLEYGLKSQGATFENNSIIILDTLGELSKVYALSSVAFIGGSFAPIGGHNPLEATIYSKPTVSGPCIKNFRDIYSTLSREKSSFVVKNENELFEILYKLFNDEKFYEEIVSNTKTCFENQQGALNFVIKELKEILN